MSDGPRVAMLLDWFFVYAASIANGLASRGVEVMVVTRDHGFELGLPGEAGDAKRDMLDPAVRLVLIEGRQRDPRGLASFKRAADELRAFSPNVVHAQDHGDWRLYALQRMLPSASAFLTVHDVVPHLGARERANRLQRFVARAMRRRAHTLVVHGEGLADLARRQEWYSEETRIVSIPHPVLTPPMAPAPLPAEPILLFFGRLERYKGLDVLVEAAESASAAVPGLRVVVAGAGPDGERVRRLVRKPELFEWREAFVPSDEVESLFARAALVVLPYREASQSGVVPIAFAQGRTVVASDVGSLAEAVSAEVDGLLVPPDDPGALAAALVRVLTDRSLLERLSAAAFETAATGRMSQGHVADLHLAAYDAASAEEAS